VPTKIPGNIDSKHSSLRMPRGVGETNFGIQESIFYFSCRKTWKKSGKLRELMFWSSY